MSITTPSAVPELRDAHQSARILPYLREVWDRRSYIWYVAVNELHSRQITNVLGNLWHLLNPMLSIGVYYVIFGQLLETNRGVEGNFLLFLTVGLFVFQFTQKSTTDGARSIIANTGLLKGIRFPRAILPITSTVTELVASLSNFAVMFLILLIGGQAPLLSWLLFPVVVVVQMVFNLGCAMIAARMTTHFRDTTQILPFVFRLLLYTSGVIFSVDGYAVGRPYLDTVFMFNPIYCFLTLARWTTFGGSLSGGVIISAAIWTIAMVVGGFLWFRAAEDRYARD